MDPLHDLRSWRKQPMLMRSTTWLVNAEALVAVMAAVLVMSATARPAQAEFPGEHKAVAFEKAGDVWVASKMHLVNLTPNTAAYSDVDPSVSPDGRDVLFASDRDGDFEIYTVNVFTAKVQRVTNNAVSDRSPAWSRDGQKTIHEAQVPKPQKMDDRG